MLMVFVEFYLYICNGYINFGVGINGSNIIILIAI